MVRFCFGFFASFFSTPLGETTREVVFDELVSGGIITSQLLRTRNSPVAKKSDSYLSPQNMILFITTQPHLPRTNYHQALSPDSFEYKLVSLERESGTRKSAQMNPAQLESYLLLTSGCPVSTLC